LVSLSLLSQGEPRTVAALDSWVAILNVNLTSTSSYYG
jgi:hypothetical protein